MQNRTESNEIYGEKKKTLKNEMSTHVNPMQVIHAPRCLQNDKPKIKQILLAYDGKNACFLFFLLIKTNTCGYYKLKEIMNITKMK